MVHRLVLMNVPNLWHFKLLHSKLWHYAAHVSSLILE